MPYPQGCQTCKSRSSFMQFLFQIQLYSGSIFHKSINLFDLDQCGSRHILLNDLKIKVMYSQYADGNVFKLYTAICISFQYSSRGRFIQKWDILTCTTVIIEI